MALVVRRAVAATLPRLERGVNKKLLLFLAREGTGALAWEAAGLAAIVAGIVLLGLHPAMPRGPAPKEPSLDLQPR